MAIQVRSNVNFNKNTAINIGLERLTTAPQNPKVNQIYVDANDNLIKQYNGSEWVSLGFSGGMIYKGTVGTGGTVTTLPSNVDDVANGDTYKVCADGTYAGQVAVVGDLFVAVITVDSSTTPATKTLSWSYIPSGNDKFIGTITGDGTTTTFSITHTLNTVNTQVAVYDAATNEHILVDTKSIIDNSVYKVQVIFDIAPIVGENYTVVILA